MQYMHEMPGVLDQNANDTKGSTRGVSPGQPALLIASRLVISNVFASRTHTEVFQTALAHESQ